MNVTSLLKTVKAVEDEHTRGTRAMEATVEAITQEIKAMQSSESLRGSPATPEDLIRVTKNVTSATAKAVAAGASNLQEDIAAASNLGRRTISEMLTVCKAVAWTCAESADIRQRTLDAGASVAISYRDLLEGVLRNCSADDRMQLSRRVAKCVTDLVGMAQLLKGKPTRNKENEILNYMKFQVQIGLTLKIRQSLLRMNFWVQLHQLMLPPKNLPAYVLDDHPWSR